MKERMPAFVFFCPLINKKVIGVCLLDLIFQFLQQSFSDVGTAFPKLHQYYAGINVSCSWTQRSGASQAQTHDSLVSSQAFYH